MRARNQKKLQKWWNHKFTLTAPAAKGSCPTHPTPSSSPAPLTLTPLPETFENLHIVCVCVRVYMCVCVCVCVHVHVHSGAVLRQSAVQLNWPIAVIPWPSFSAQKETLYSHDTEYESHTC